MGLDTKAGVTAVQVWLKSRGYKVKVTGSYADGGVTHRARRSPEEV